MKRGSLCSLALEELVSRVLHELAHLEDLKERRWLTFLKTSKAVHALSCLTDSASSPSAIDVAESVICLLDFSAKLVHNSIELQPTLRQIT